MVAQAVTMLLGDKDHQDSQGCSAIHSRLSRGLASEDVHGQVW